MSTANRTARARPTTDTATRSAWLFPGRTELAIAVNWRQATVEGLMQDLKLAREREAEKDSTHIARFRRLSARCELALARCQDALAGC